MAEWCGIDAQARRNVSPGGGVGSSREDCKAQLFLVPELQVEMPESHGRGGLGATAAGA